MLHKEDLFFVIYFFGLLIALVFQGGVPQLLTVRSRQVISYSDRLIYTRPEGISTDCHRTLYWSKNGELLSSRAVLGPRFYVTVYLPASKEEHLLWKQTKAIVSDS